jgi:IMP cyclohydrolase
MSRTTGILSTREYPGRMVALGIEPGGGRAVVIYAITGRSPSSQARKLVFRDGGFWVEPADESLLKKANVDLLIYPAVLFEAGDVAVSNGRQTMDIRDRLPAGESPVSALAAALENWDYEPDPPIHTPRIAGCLLKGRAGLGLVRRGAAGETLRSYFDIPLRPGRARLISTYRGPNRNPVPCFTGEPLEIPLQGGTPRQTAEYFYRGLAPRTRGRDFRVAAVCIFLPPAGSGDFEYSIINRQERTRGHEQA